VVVLNATASDVWRLCDGDQTLDEIVDLIASAYSMQPETVRGDVTDTVNRLIDEGFLPS
jgi:hypothetical protein